MKTWLFLAAFIVLISCSKTTIDQPSENEKYPAFTLHTIKKGEHYAETNRLQLFNGNSLHFKVIFDSTAIYQNIQAENKLDINKLYGFSDCSTQHHVNSARFGWRWNGRSVDILAYTYVNKQRQSKFLGTALIGEEIDYSLSIHKHEYEFRFKQETVVMPRSCETDNVTGYLLYPYFGGDEAAPHDVHVYIRELKSITN